MRNKKTVWIAFAATFAITIGAGWIPAAIMDDENLKQDVAVFRGEPIVHLSNANIVDALANVNLRERLGHAEWKHSVLSLELLVPSEGGRPEAWFDDIGKLVGVSFHQLDNVNRLLVRIVENAEGEKRLLAAVDVRSSDAWLHGEEGGAVISDPVHDEVWRQRLRLSFTSAWVERFGVPEGYSAHSKRQFEPDIAK
ncbi:hypothetical protein [Paenibacillus soyae]|uniref:Uncharacterized protein n=1 Tax=Paenibacillus soyae TaxID=2969249 RepID=A0A9X2MLU2_9BACL|nr:hypothetical protein [Paenibacillus soyae]MCR2803019.1 hypothetical protein [Paenibacillus soyae]